MTPSATHEPARIPSIPRDTAEGRELLQARIASFGCVATWLTLGFGAMGGGLLTVADMGEHAWQVKATAAHLSAALAYGAIWLVARRPAPLSPRLLGAFDLSLVLACSISFVLMGWQMPAAGRPEILAVFGVGQALALRAVFIPSTRRRTALVSTAAALPVVIFSYGYYASHPFPAGGSSPLVYAYISLMLCASVVVMSSITSQVIYGLREKVRQARELGQYTLLEKIGEGGMGAVYRAKHAMLRRPTAVKLLLAERSGEQTLARFEREAQLTSLLSHPNTVSVYDFGRTPDGVFYYAMEYLDGIDLEALVRHDGPQPPSRVVYLLGQVCGALIEAHGIGLIHRDIKPQNLLLCERAGLADVVKVVDFGLVKAITPSGSLLLSGDQSTETQLVGTPLYMSPEAILSPERVGARSDLYALGAVAYYLLSGTPPFRGGSVVEICGHHLHTPASPPSERLGAALPAELEAIVLACLSKDEAGRPASAAELARRLGALDITPAWTVEDARDGWKRRGQQIRTLARAESAQTHVAADGRPATVAIDLRHR